MTPEELKDRIAAILKSQADPENAHSMEDDLPVDIIKAFCPEWMVRR